MSAAVAAAPASGGEGLVDHAALLDMARHFGVKPGDHAPFIMYTAGELAIGQDGGAYAWDVSRCGGRALKRECRLSKCADTISFRNSNPCVCR